jgi:hypothetical protein
MILTRAAEYGNGKGEVLIGGRAVSGLIPRRSFAVGECSVHPDARKKNQYFFVSEPLDEAGRRKEE